MADREMTEREKAVLNALFQALTAKGKGYKNILEVKEMVELTIADCSGLIDFESGCLQVAKSENVFEETIKIIQNSDIGLFEKNEEKSEKIQENQSKPTEKEQKPVKKMVISNDGYDMKAKAKEVDTVPAGLISAICTGFFGLGVQQWEYQGAKKQGLKVIAVFQTSETDDEGTPLFITQEFTHSMSTKSNLYAVIKSWLGRAPNAEEMAGGFDLEKLAGKPCMINVVHNTSKTTGNTYANVAGVSPLPKGTAPLEPVDEIPDWIVIKINELREKAIKE